MTKYQPKLTDSGELRFYISKSVFIAYEFIKDSLVPQKIIEQGENLLRKFDKEPF